MYIRGSAYYPPSCQKPHNIPEYVAEKPEIAEVGVEFDVHTQLKRGITEMQIERANLDDLQEILDLQYLAYQSEAELFPDQDIPPLKQTLTEVITEYQKGIILKVSDEDNVIIGSVRHILLMELFILEN